METFDVRECDFDSLHELKDKMFDIATGEKSLGEPVLSEKTIKMTQSQYEKFNSFFQPSSRPATVFQGYKIEIV